MREKQTSFTFTYDRYRLLLSEFVSKGYTFRKFGEGPKHKTIYLRHDVDWSPKKAHKMALIESEYGIESTYFVLVTSPLYNPMCKHDKKIIRKIADLGHEVSVHFSTHNYWSQNPGNEILEERVEDEIEILQQVVNDVDPVVSFHIPPDWVLEKDYTSFLNTYGTKWFTEMEYIADSSQRWRDQHPLESGLSETIQLLTHPGLWGNEDRSFESRLEAAQQARFKSVEQWTADEFLPE